MIIHRRTGDTANKFEGLPGNFQSTCLYPVTRYKQVFETKSLKNPRMFTCLPGNNVSQCYLYARIYLLIDTGYFLSDLSSKHQNGKFR